MNQVIPYLPYASEDLDLSSLFEGLIERHARSICIDPFANSFNFNASGDGHQTDIRIPPMTPSVFEGKYEIDSLFAFVKLSFWTWQSTSDASLFRFALHSDISNQYASASPWLEAVGRVLDTSIRNIFWKICSFCIHSVVSLISSEDATR